MKKRIKCTTNEIGVGLWIHEYVHFWVPLKFVDTNETKSKRFTGYTLSLLRRGTELHSNIKYSNIQWDVMRRLWSTARLALRIRLMIW